MNLPNKITILRIGLIPIMLWFIMQEDLVQYSIGYALAIFIGITDYLDGYIARRFGSVTRLGEFLDPVADKIFIISCFVYCTKISFLPGWLLILIIAREIAVTDLRIYATNKKINIKVSALGKTKTLLQNLLLLYLGCVRILQLLAYQDNAFRPLLDNPSVEIIRIMLLCFVAVLTFLSMFLYIISFTKQAILQDQLLNTPGLDSTED